MPVSRTAQPEHTRATMVSSEIPPVPLTIEGYSAASDDALSLVRLAIAASGTKSEGHPRSQ